MTLTREWRGFKDISGLPIPDYLSTACSSGASSSPGYGDKIKSWPVQERRSGDTHDPVR